MPRKPKAVAELRDLPTIPEELIERSTSAIPQESVKKLFYPADVMQSSTPPAAPA
ncbi:hypothetical protein IAG25_12740 [Caballeronia sp. EK]|uniref:hypothetical protein n=1 Tax=Caballeronia sp. EK TaxID=2767469 RepID=UPI0016562630|nr:hypothetical protein [Caballeronia sp. EK]MBC8637681.1 hypothetical protein [Caballeronia sp. EK]